MIDLHPRPAALIAASLDGPLTTDERQEVDHHLDGCSACRRLERKLRADAAALSVPSRIAPPPAIRTAIERQVAIPSVDPGLVRALRLAVVVALVLVAVVVLAIGVALLQPRQTEPLQTREPEPIGLHRSEGPW